jgi:hypothetical protein
MFFEWLNSSKRVARMWKMAKEVFIHVLTKPMTVFKKCSI